VDREQYDFIADKITMSEEFYQTVLAMSPKNLQHCLVLDVGWRSRTFAQKA
jgi:hypothetical protein